MNAIGQIPQHVQSQRGRGAGEAIDLGGVGELLFDGGSGGGLRKLAEARAGVGEAPGGNFDLERVQHLCCQIKGCRFGLCHVQLPFSGLIAPFELRNVANENHMEKAWPVDAFDARHFNVCRGAGPGDPGDERGWLLGSGEVLGQRFNHLAGA